MSGAILLIDDDPLIRTVVADNLSDEGFAVHSAANESQAFATLDAYSDIGLAIVDYCLPRPIGIDLCRRIAAEYPDTAVALYTGHAELASIRLDGEDITVLSKSLRHEHLVVAVRDLLGGKSPDIRKEDLASRVEVMWRKELKRETVKSVGRAMHNAFDETAKEPLPSSMLDTMSRLLRIRSA